jgi:hypothetical protein
VHAYAAERRTGRGHRIRFDGRHHPRSVRDLVAEQREFDPGASVHREPVELVAAIIVAVGILSLGTAGSSNAQATIIDERSLSANTSGRSNVAGTIVKVGPLAQGAQGGSNDSVVLIDVETLSAITAGQSIVAAQLNTIGPLGLVATVGSSSADGVLSLPPVSQPGYGGGGDQRWRLGQPLVLRPPKPNQPAQRVRVVMLEPFASSGASHVTASLDVRRVSVPAPAPPTVPLAARPDPIVDDIELPVDAPVTRISVARHDQAIALALLLEAMR